jgi:hypothetical protein
LRATAGVTAPLVARITRGVLAGFMSEVCNNSASWRTQVKAPHCAAAPYGNGGDGYRAEYGNRREAGDTA